MNIGGVPSSLLLFVIVDNVAVGGDAGVGVPSFGDGCGVTADVAVAVITITGGVGKGVGANVGGGKGVGKGVGGNVGGGGVGYAVGIGNVVSRGQVVLEPPLTTQREKKSK